MLGLVFRTFIYLILKIFSLRTIPIFVLRLFNRRKACSPITNDLLLLSASTLAEKIRMREITAEEVISSYIDRIKQVNPIINAVIEERFEDAVEEAKLIEGVLNSGLTVTEIKEMYPLLGVPFTVKGSIALEGLNHCAGVLLRKKTALKNADSVQRLKDLGAIPLLVSNTPEFCLNWETTNKLIGTTNNPYDSRRTVGGSSGGEGALISSGASLIGVGSDIAGSLRLPMHFCGVWGHKPTPRIISVDGHYPSSPEEDWPDVFHIGPISRYASDLSMLFEILVDPAAKSQLKIPNDLKRLKVYCLKDVNNFMVRRTNSDTKKAIQEVVNYFNNYTETSICREINENLLAFASEDSFMRLILVDNVENLFDGKGRGAHFELLKFTFGLSKSVFTSICYGLLRWWLWIIPEKYKKKCHQDISNLKSELLKILDDDSILILPVFTSEALYHGEMLHRIFDCGYCSIFNSLGLPSTVCPVMQTNEGMPIGIQVVAAPYCDRLCLAVAQEIEKAFGGWRFPQQIHQENANKNGLPQLLIK